MVEEKYLNNMLVATKMLVPPLLSHTLIPRPRLVDRLNLGLARKLTLVCAPAGFGKTTLVAQWLQLKARSGQAVEPAYSCAETLKLAWVSLDQDDNEILLFWKYVLTALEYSEPGLAAPLLEQLNANREELSLQSILTALINSVLEYDRHFILVLDDYQVITSKEVNASLGFLLDHLPPQLHLFIISRSEPYLPLARLRGRGQTLELNIDLLACTMEETAAFLKEILQLKLQDAEIKEIFNRSEGWLAGLQLFGLSLLAVPKRASEKALEELTGTHPYITDYFINEVLHKQPPEVQNFLVKASHLPRFCAPLCDKILARNDSREMLDYLLSSNLFIVRLDEPPGWYRYHNLFRETLRSQLDRQGSETVSKLERLAKAWYSEQTAKSKKLKPVHNVPEISREVKIADLIRPPDTRRTLAILEKPSQGPKTGKGRAITSPVKQGFVFDNLPLLIEPLSGRELEVLNLLTQGAANQAIAAELTVSLNTVKKHTSNIFSKLGVPNRTQAVYLARKLGLIME